MVASFLWPDLLFLFGLLLLATSLGIISLHPSWQQCWQLILRNKEKQRQKRKTNPRISLCLELWGKNVRQRCRLVEAPRASGLLSQDMATVPWPTSGRAGFWAGRR